MGAVERRRQPPKNHRVVFPWLSYEACEAFEREAVMRFTTRDALIAMVLEKIGSHSEPDKVCRAILGD
jgi:hypothetical protein